MPEAFAAAVSALTLTGKLRVGIDFANFLPSGKAAASAEPRGSALDFDRELGRQLRVIVEIVTDEHSFLRPPGKIGMGADEA